MEKDIAFTPLMKSEERKKLEGKYRREFRAILGYPSKRTKVADLDSKFRAAEGLVDQAAFLSMCLYELNQTIVRDGYWDTYKNGAAQWGTKRSVAAEVYDRYLKAYASIIKQIVDLLLDEDADPDAGEMVKQFMAQRPGTYGTG